MDGGVAMALKEENKAGEGCGEKAFHLAGQGWVSSHPLFTSPSHLVLINSALTENTLLLLLHCSFTGV